MNASDPTLAYLSLPWTWQFGLDKEEDCWIATIDELPDFFAAGGDRDELARNAREALLSHLRGYLATGTPIPMQASPRRDLVPPTSAARREGLVAVSL